LRGAVQDSAEESYEPRPKFDAPARESCSRGAKTAAKVAPAAQETAATANGYEWRHQQDFRSKPEPSPWGGTGGYGDPPLADNEPPDEGGGGPVNQLPQRQESSTCKVVGCNSPHRDHEVWGPGGPLVEGQQTHHDGQVWRKKYHEGGIGEEKTSACFPLMRLAFSQRRGTNKKTDLCQFCFEQKKGSVCLSAGGRKGHFCKESGNPNRHTSAMHQNPIQVHSLGI
jgi:hypothetical protein